MVVLGLLVACPHDRADPEAFVGAWAVQQCERSDACDCRQHRDDCEQYMLSQLSEAQRRARAAGAVFDADCLERHRDLLESSDCALLTDLVARPEVDWCQIYHGDKQLGEACTFYDGGAVWRSLMSDCAQGLTCAGLGRRCVAAGEFAVIAKQGERCLDDDDRAIALCEDGSACDTYGTRTCVAPHALGDACPGDSPCVASWCDAEICVAPRADGEGCTRSEGCTSRLCGPDGTCIPRPEPEPAACTPFLL